MLRLFTFFPTQGSLEMVELLLNRGADINKKDDASRTALHALMFCRHKTQDTLLILNLFLDHGCNINARYILNTIVFINIQYSMMPSTTGKRITNNEIQFISVFRTFSHQRYDISSSFSINENH